MGGESTLVLLKEREKVYWANSKLKNNRYESSTHYRETTGEAFEVPFAELTVRDISPDSFCNWPQPTTQNPSPVPAMLPKINSVPKSVKIAPVLVGGWISLILTPRSSGDWVSDRGNFTPPQLGARRRIGWW